MSRFLMLAACALACGIGFVAARTVPATDDQLTPAQRARQDFELMKLFAEAYEQIDSHYVREVDRRQLVDGAIRGMIAQLDPYSAWIPPQDIQRFEQVLDQEFVGIGIHVHPVGGRLEVLAPLPQSPAYRAGVRSGDVLMEVDGKAVAGLSPGEVGKLLAGPVGRAVTLGVRHVGSEVTERFEIVRETVQVPTVTGVTRTPEGGWTYLLDADRKIAYLRITHFSRNTVSEMQTALAAIRELNPSSLILDVRSNPGGLLDSAIAIADMFLETGRIVSMDGRKVPERSWTAKPGTEIPSTLPLTILINRQSASASEVLSAALQDNKRARIVGERSWGKGSVQTVIQMEDGKSAMKLTTASYLRPNGVNIHRFPDSKKEDQWGVMPDDGGLVELDKEQWIAWSKTRDGVEGFAGQIPPAEMLASDLQLTKAVELLKAPM